MPITDTTVAHPTPFVEIPRDEWAQLAPKEHLSLTETEIVQLRGLGDRLDIQEVQEVYLPLSRLLTLYAAGARNLHASTSAFLGERASRTPFVIGVAARSPSASPPSRDCCAS